MKPSARFSFSLITLPTFEHFPHRLTRGSSSVSKNSNVSVTRQKRSLSLNIRNYFIEYWYTKGRYIKGKRCTHIPVVFVPLLMNVSIPKVFMSRGRVVYYNIYIYIYIIPGIYFYIYRWYLRQLKLENQPKAQQNKKQKTREMAFFFPPGIPVSAKRPNDPGRFYSYSGIYIHCLEYGAPRSQENSKSSSKIIQHRCSAGQERQTIHGAPPTRTRQNHTQKEGSRESAQHHTRRSYEPAVEQQQQQQQQPQTYTSHEHHASTDHQERSSTQAALGRRPLLPTMLMCYSGTRIDGGWVVHTVNYAIRENTRCNQAQRCRYAPKKTVEPTSGMASRKPQHASTLLDSTRKGVVLAGFSMAHAGVGLEREGGAAGVAPAWHARDYRERNIRQQTKVEEREVLGWFSGGQTVVSSGSCCFDVFRAFNH